ncbi:FeoA family protein [Solilutibacter tolerans]|uniref:Ferrous iron transport protein A n=1 Tax=Solilutibacter tolerans TaxID=1604334 RepID=A0A1N6X9G3_9GAMM|nr:FeoA family protein [Lysobacter tolerans]SIQ98988.1 ferrous iron transport protein A [Lysobacter tolerans]
MRLVDLPKNASALVVAVHAHGESDAIARRLGEIGFVPGEPVEVRAAGPLGREPLMVQVGYTRFALRRSEAARVEVMIEVEAAPE